MEPIRLAVALTEFVFLLPFFLLHLNISASLAENIGGEGGRGGQRSLVLPLFDSSAGSSRAIPTVRRSLHATDSNSLPDARMRLYDDLLLDGYYTTRLWIGTPPQIFALIVDTGSTVTYVPCSSCERCGIHQDPKLQPELSSSYQPVKCNKDCTCDKDKKQCTYERQYAESSTSSGGLGEDVVSFGNVSELAPQRVIFGCENVETGDLYSQRADGILGLGRGNLGVVDQLVEKDVISDCFALCYGGMDIGGGAMVLGDFSSPSDMVFANSDPARSPYYNIDLREIHVAGKSLSLNPKVFDGKHGTILDSGTTYAYLPKAAFDAFKEAIIEELSLLRKIEGPDPNYKDICFSGAMSDVSELSKKFPVVEMVFGSGQKLLLSPENYLFRHSKVRGAYCLGIFQNGHDTTTLLGGIIVRNTLVMYDRKNAKIGFSKTNCSEFWKRLQQDRDGSSSPGNKTYNAPSFVSRDTQVGRIIFQVSLNTSYSRLKPQVTQLFESLAHELQIDVLQLHLLNFTSEANISLATWVVVPLGSASYISHDTAMRIISKLQERRNHLFDKFGGYELVELQVLPVVKRSFWERHRRAVVMSILFVITFVLFASGALLIWRHLQSRNPYKPVDGAVSEQELPRL